MRRLYLTENAKADLREIARFGRGTWGPRVRRDYIVSMREFFQLLVENPGMGRSVNFISEGLYRIEYASHVVFFRRMTDGIKVSRILHKNMDYKSQAFDRPENV